MPFTAIWTQLNIKPTVLQTLSRSSHALVAHAGKAYIFGGELQPRIPVDGTLYSLDLSGSQGQENSIIEATTQGPAPRVGTAMAKVGDAIYLWGGRGGKEMKPLSGELWKFNLGNTAWERLKTNGDQPEDRSYHVLTGVQPHTLYLHAGCPAFGRLSTLQALDLRTLTWRSLASAPEPARGGTVLASIPSIGSAGSLIRFGGFAGHELGGPLDIYDIAANKWKSVTPQGESPSARSVHALLGVPTKKGSDLVAVMFGGEHEPAPAELGHNGAGSFLSDVWALRHTENGGWIWESVPVKEGGAVPHPRGWFAVDVTEKGEFVVQGGLNEKNERMGDAWVLKVEEH